jgi:PleD family two-component response regulator
VEEAIREIEQGDLWIPWMEVETLATSTWMETEALLPREPVDVILLNPNLRDCQGAALFRRVRSLASQVPILLLIDTADRELALQLVREGAQDFLIKKQIDCAPLAHSIRNAMERQRILEALRATTMTDPLTGLLHRGAFYTLAERDRQLAERLARRLLVVVAEPADAEALAATAGEQRRDLALVEASDFLRSLAGGTWVVGRVGEFRFALALFDTSSEPIERAWFRVHAAATQQRIRIGAAIFEPEDPVHVEILLDRAEANLHAPGLTARSAAVRL